MDLNDFDYPLPEELIAQHPRPRRGQSRLLVLHRRDGRIEHRQFSDLVEYFRPGDGLVVNETRVMPARLLGRRRETGGKVEILLVRDRGEGRWQFLVKPSRRAGPGIEFTFGDDRLICQVEERIGPGEWTGRFRSREDLAAVLEELGQTPLPPYIRRPPEENDRDRYQTVYARHDGAVAAPTAGLHFTRDLLEEISGRGIEIVPILLHVGPGTFRPVKETRIDRHRMEAEYYRISPAAAASVNRIRKQGGRIVVVGTTAVRALESCAAAGRAGPDTAEPDATGPDTAGPDTAGPEPVEHESVEPVPRETGGAEPGAGAEGTWLKPGEGWTELFIHPPFSFRLTDALITNFHLPRSTLLMLISALAGRELILQAYREAIAERYLFYSYGDAMLIL
jgi:S-adenosylmethionine:tRNA ribosyltransferase-isomerase